MTSSSGLHRNHTFSRLFSVSMAHLRKLSNNDVEHLIELVRHNEALYNAGMKEHSDAPLVANIWVSISENMKADPPYTGKKRPILYYRSPP